MDGTTLLYDYTVCLIENFLCYPTLWNAVSSEYDNRGSFSRFKMTILVEKLDGLFCGDNTCAAVSGAALLMFALAPDDGVDSRLVLGSLYCSQWLRLYPWLRICRKIHACLFWTNA